MIRYTLRCAQDHTSDSWFQSAAAFDTLSARGMVTCAVCGSTSVEKALMAPRIGQGDAQPGTPTRPPAPAPQAATPSLLSTPSTPMEAAIAELRRQVEAVSDYVGPRFADEARRMHDGDAPSRPIHGEARPDEARALIEDGVPVMPLPFGPRSRTN